MSDKLKFQIREYQGTEVFKYRAADHPDHIHQERLLPLTQRGDLAPEDVILVPALVGGGYFLMTVKESPEGLQGEAQTRELCAEADKLLAILRFGEDERNAWICVGLINKRGLEKLRITL